MQAIAEIQAPPEVLQALRYDGRRSGQWIRTRCPYCDPDGRGRRNLAASHSGFGRNRDRPGWLCHACHAEEHHRSERLATARMRYDPDAARNDKQRRTDSALQIIASSRPIEEGDPADRYLRKRGLKPPTALWPSSLRSANLTHPETRQRHPVLLGVVTDVENVAIAVHRTYLTDQGLKADVTPVKMSLGPVTGGAVRLGVDSAEVIVAEGIESALGAAMASGLVAWAALSAGNMTRLKIPRSVKRVAIAADADPVGRKSAWTLRAQIADLKRDIDVVMRYPPRGRSDFADFG